MTATLNRDDIIKQYNDARIELNDGTKSSVDVSNLSTEFMHARLKFAEWYDAKSEDEQELIDEISDRTYNITDESDYDDFIELLDDYGITNAQQFEDAFEMEFEGYGEHLLAKFAEEFCDAVGYSNSIPDLFTNCIDWEMVWYSNLRHDYMVVEFNNNTYILRNDF